MLRKTTGNNPFDRKSSEDLNSNDYIKTFIDLLKNEKKIEEKLTDKNKSKTDLKNQNGQISHLSKDN